MTLKPLGRHRARCRETRAQMSDYLDGDLSADAARRLKRHTAWCPNCGRMMKNLRRTVGGLQALRDMPTGPTDGPVS